MEVSALRYSGGMGLHGRSPLLRLQSDERLIVLIRRGNSAAFEVLVARYHSRLLAFCRHLLGSKEDAEDVLQEVLAAAFNAILADERAINVRPWLYRIARNRSLNHLRRIQAIGIDSMDIHFSEYGATTADKVHDREQFRLLVHDIHSLPETQRTALVLREMDALSYEQIAEAMDTTVPGVKSLLVRARISLAEAAEARQLSCDEVRLELAEVAEGLHKRPPALVRRHLRSCTRCATFQSELKQTNKVLAALLPVGPLALFRKLLIVHLGHSAGTGSGATAGAAGATSATGAGASGLAAGQAAAVAGSAGGAAAFGSAGSLVSAGAGALATKAAAGLAAAALVTAGAVEVTHVVPQSHQTPTAATRQPATGGASLASTPSTLAPNRDAVQTTAATKPKPHTVKAKPGQPLLASTATTSPSASATPKPESDQSKTHKAAAGQTQTQTDPTVLNSSGSTSGSNGQATDASGNTTTTSSSASGSTSSGCGSDSGTSSSGSTSGSTTPTSTTAASTSPTTTTTTTTTTNPSGGSTPTPTSTPTTTTVACSASPPPATP
jgi:RNA polymerase sigma factor (sigma-70 family)